MKKFTQKGFTLIELLVVIAIIGILSSVVLVSLNSARSKGGDAAIQGNLNAIRTQAELWANNQSTPTYATTAFAAAACPGTTQTGNILNDSTIISAINGASTQAGGSDNSDTRCAVRSNGWAIASQLKSGGTAGDSTPDAWCVDSSGIAKPYTYTSGQTIANTITDNSSGNTASCN